MADKTSLKEFKDRITRMPFAWQRGANFGFGITYENKLMFYKESGALYMDLPLDKLHLNGGFLSTCEFAPQTLH